MEHVHDAALNCQECYNAEPYQFRPAGGLMPPSKMDEWFKARWWRVVTEADGEATVPYATEDEEPAIVTARFTRGHFTVEPPGAFKSPLSGNPGRKGVLLQEVDAGHKDIPGSRYPFGEAAVAKAREEYGAII